MSKYVDAVSVTVVLVLLGVIYLVFLSPTPPLVICKPGVFYGKPMPVCEEQQ